MKNAHRVAPSSVTMVDHFKYMIFTTESEKLLEKGINQNSVFTITDYYHAIFTKISDNPDDVYKRLKPESRKCQFVADQICRRDPTRRFHFPQSQIFLYDSSSRLPRRPFGLPSYYYHYGDRLIKNTHETNNEIGLELKDAGRKHNIEVHSSHASIFEKNDDGSNGTKIAKFSNPIYMKEVTDANFDAKRERTDRIVFEKKKIALKDGNLYQGSWPEPIPTRLNGLPMRDHKIVRIEFGEPQPGTCDVLVLLDGNFMAGGTLDKNAKFISLSLSEIPGTYGTTDFICGPHFKSMVRVSSGSQVRKTPTSHLLFDYDFLEEVAELVRKRTFRHSEIDFLKDLCENIRILCVLFEELGTFKFIHQQKTWSPAEKLAFTSQELSKSGHLSKCDDDCAAVQVQKLCDISKVFVEKKDAFSDEEDAEMMEEYTFQLSMALLALYSATDGEEMSEDIREATLLLTDFKRLYSLPIEKLIRIILLLPDEMIRRTMDVVASRATHRHTPLFLQLYQHEPELVMNMFKEHGHLLLHNPHPLWPQTGFLNKFLDWFVEQENAAVPVVIPVSETSLTPKVDIMEKPKRPPKRSAAPVSLSEVIWEESKSPSPKKARTKEPESLVEQEEASSSVVVPVLKSSEEKEEVKSPTKLELSPTKLNASEVPQNLTESPSANLRKLKSRREPVSSKLLDNVFSQF